MKVTTFSVVGALLVAVPIAAFAAHPRGNNPPPDVLESAMPAPARDALFERADLWRAKAPVPAVPGWEGCDTHVTTELPSDAPYLDVFAYEAIHTNLDDDSGLETAVLVECRMSGKPVSQVVGYDIGAAGEPVSLGTVVNPLNPGHISGLSRRIGGGVIVTVMYSHDYSPDNPEPPKREFAWDGKGFRQVGGPTAFPERGLGDLSVTAGPLVLHPLDNGVRTGSITVTVRYEGASPTPFLRIDLGMDALLTVGDRADGNAVNLAGLRPGETKVFDLVVQVRNDRNSPTMTVEVHSSYIRDTVPENNQVVVAINRL